jgi:hypothetical protein
MLLARRLLYEFVEQTTHGASIIPRQIHR